MVVFWSSLPLLRNRESSQAFLFSLSDELGFEVQASRWSRRRSTCGFQRILGNYPQHPAVFSEGAQQSGVPFVSGVQQALSV